MYNTHSYQRCYIVAEIGINHNGDLSLAKQLIDVAVSAQCNAVKFQKRSVDINYTPEELAQARSSPFGETNGQLKYGLEFGYKEYEEIFGYCRKHAIDCFASEWDEPSVDFMEQFDPVFHKIPSPMLTHTKLLKHCRQYDRAIILSTGMSTMEQIGYAVDILGAKDLFLMHCVSAYPCPVDEINLRGIQTLRETFGCPVGYSGHEYGIFPSIAAVALGACVIERHVTVSRNLWGSDQAMSLEPHDLKLLVEGIRTIEKSMGTGEIIIQDIERPALAKLRRMS